MGSTTRSAPVLEDGGFICGRYVGRIPTPTPVPPETPFAAWSDAMRLRREHHRSNPWTLLLDVSEDAGPAVRTEFWFTLGVLGVIVAIFALGFVVGFFHGWVGLW